MFKQYSGSRGSIIEKSLYSIQEAFERHIDRLRNLDYDILDVKATRWHDDYNYFKNGVKDLEVLKFYFHVYYVYYILPIYRYSNILLLIRCSLYE